MSTLYAHQTATHSFVPPPPRQRSQRTCACGRPIGPTGECAECRRKRLLSQARAGGTDIATDRMNPPPARGAGHKFESLRVQSPGAIEEPAPVGLSATNVQEDEEEKMIDGVLVTAALPCYGSGGESVCNPSTGNYDITANNNTCCTRDCTQQHEQQHVDDLGDCCQKLADAISAGGNRNDLIRRYNQWMRGGASDWSECNSYQVSLGCAQQLSRENNCDSQSSQCCDEIQDYMDLANRQHNNYCAKAPANRPACPF